MASEPRAGVQSSRRAVQTAADNRFIKPDDPGARCGSDARSDVGLSASGLGVLLVTTARSRVQVALGGGYYRYLCTPSLSRPVGGLDLRFEHRPGSRTFIAGSARAVVDQFDRTLDLRLGIDDKQSVTGMASGAAGTPFLTASAGVEAEHTFVGRYGLRGALSAQTLQILGPLQDLTQLSSLGPMEVGELQVTPFKDTVRDRLEIPLRYQLGHYYPATLLGVKDRSDAALSQDGSVGFAWERRPDPRWVLRLGAGLAWAYQPNLCVTAGSCSIDTENPDIRGGVSSKNPPKSVTVDAPFAEVGIGRRGTGTFTGEASVLFRDRRALYEIRLARGYEPSAYAGALVLANRLSVNARYRVSPDLAFLGSLQLAQLGGSSLGRVLKAGEDALRGSPQNRDFLAAQGSLGVDWYVVGPLAVFGQADFAVFSIRGAQVTDPEDPLRAVGGFPAENASSVNARLTMMLGLRIAARPSAREIDLLQTARMLP